MFYFILLLNPLFPDNIVSATMSPPPIPRTHYFHPTRTYNHFESATTPSLQQIMQRNPTTSAHSQIWNPSRKTHYFQIAKGAPIVNRIIIAMWYFFALCNTCMKTSSYPSWTFFYFLGVLNCKMKLSGKVWESIEMLNMGNVGTWITIQPESMKKKPKMFLDGCSWTILGIELFICGSKTYGGTWRLIIRIICSCFYQRKSRTDEKRTQI